jgi:PAS domain S-box-containing protein
MSQSNMGKPIRVLLVEDNPNDAELVLRELRRAGFEPHWSRVDTEEAFLSNLNRELDIILSDYQMPQFSGLRALELLQQQGLDTPFIIISGTIGEDVAVATMKGGANDYLLKDRLGRLGQSVTHALSESQMHRERQVMGVALKHAESRYRSIFENAIEGIYQSTPEGRFITANPALARILGYPSPEALIEQVSDIPRDLYVVPEQRQKLRKLLFEQGSVSGYESQIKRLDGQSIWVSESVRVVTEAEGQFHYEGMIEDITERKRAEAALRASEERYRSLVEASSQVVWSTDAEGNVTNVTNIEGVLGEGFDLSGWKWVDTLHPEDRQYIISNWEQCLRNATVVDIEYRQMHRDGSYHYWNSRGVPIYDDHQQVRGWIGMASDITERKLLEQQFIQAQKMEAIGRLAGGIAHDFNNLLTVIIGFSQLTLNSLQPDNPTYGHLKQIEKAGHSAASLTSQMLAFSRKQIMQAKVFNLNRVVTDLQKMLQRLIGEDVELLINLAEDLGQVKADPGQIEQIIVNLAVNARDAMPQGGKLIIETANMELDEGYARSHTNSQPGQYVMLAVSDTGSGMDKQTQERIFEPFFTTKEQGKGTGLGLSTVYGITKQSGGNIWVYSEPGKGTTFKIYLPLIADPDEGVGRFAHPVEVLRGSETILLVEDEDMIRRLAYQVLEMNGYRVLEAGNANQALELCRQYTDPIHLLVTDVVLPGLSGHGLAQQIALQGREMKVLYMSGYTEDTILHHGVLESGIPFLQKPFTPDALLRKVYEVLMK